MAQVRQNCVVANEAMKSHESAQLINKALKYETYDLVHVK